MAKRLQTSKTSPNSSFSNNITLDSSLSKPDRSDDGWDDMDDFEPTTQKKRPSLLSTQNKISSNKTAFAPKVKSSFSAKKPISTSKYTNDSKSIIDLSLDNSNDASILSNHSEKSDSKKAEKSLPERSKSSLQKRESSPQKRESSSLKGKASQIEENASASQKMSLSPDKKSPESNLNGRKKTEDLSSWLDDFRSNPVLEVGAHQLSDRELFSAVDSLEKCDRSILQKVFDWFVSLPPEIADKLPGCEI
ncbi:uncharacterized protein LOC120353346 [Nilaparvata lugens]|uniref:uncharacterized protein LOC120353346 n=1 Tax=Nilaparvata lugens TaxID=108931 RepID=UPI00193E0291|nr:uncharacterized protein LOC120353346 [Nilaparvata lugens]